jgi:hypothetical protein
MAFDDITFGNEQSYFLAPPKGSAAAKVRRLRICVAR